MQPVFLSFFFNRVPNHNNYEVFYRINSYGLMVVDNDGRLAVFLRRLFSVEYLPVGKCKRSVSYLWAHLLEES